MTSIPPQPLSPVTRSPLAAPALTQSEPLARDMTPLYRTTIRPPDEIAPAGFPPVVLEAFDNAGIDRAWIIAAFQRGLSHSGATEALELSMLSVDPRHFGAARVALELIKRARVDGLCPDQVRKFLSEAPKMVVVRPDGVIAKALSGHAYEQSELRNEGGRLMAGEFEVGRLMLMRGGSVYGLDGEGPPLGHIDHGQGLHNAILDGFGEALKAAVLGAVDIAEGLVTDPLGTLGEILNGFGAMPNTTVKLAFESPDQVERFRLLPAHKQQEIVSRLISTVLLAYVTAGMSRDLVGGLIASKPKLPKITLEMRQATNGQLFPIMHVEAVAIAGGAGAANAAGALTAAQMAKLDGSIAEPRVRAAADSQLRRRKIEAPDVASKTAEDIKTDLLALKGSHPNVQLRYVQRLTEHFDKVMKQAGLRNVNSYLSLEDVKEMLEVARALLPGAVTHVEHWVGRRMRVEVQRIAEIQKPSAQRAAGLALRHFAKTTKIDLRAVLRPPAVAKRPLSKAAQVVVDKIRRGETEISTTEVVAREILEQNYGDLVDIKGVRTSTLKEMFKDQPPAFHWDKELDADGRLRFHEDTSHGHRAHLQLVLQSGDIRLYFGPELSVGSTRR